MVGSELKIETDKLPDGITVSESVIRDLRNEEEEGECREVAHLQARLLHSGGKRPRIVRCDLAYYSSDGEFLGLDKYDSQYEEESWRDDCFSLSMSLTVPDGAATAKLSIWAGHHAGFWTWAGRIIAVLFMLLLLASIWRIIED